MKRTLAATSLAAVAAAAVFSLAPAPAEAKAARACVIRHFHGDGYSWDELWCDGKQTTKLAPVQCSTCSASDGEMHPGHG